MSLAYVILGLLQQQERTGYDLKTDCFDQCIAHLWPADQAQIYRTLERLEDQGWISCTLQIQQERPNRKIYRLTDLGQQELVQWLQTHHGLPTLRDPLLVQLHFAAQLSNSAIIQLLQQELTARQQKLSECETLRRATADAHSIADQEAPVCDREPLLHGLVLDLMMRREQTYLDWLNQSIATLQNQPD
jgi:PadR family transcriptional regulator, regulatory protein AphA